MLVSIVESIAVIHASVSVQSVQSAITKVAKNLIRANRNPLLHEAPASLNGR